MNTVILTADGTLLAGGKAVHGSPLPVLGSALELGEGFTLRSFFQLLERYESLPELSAFLPSLLERATSAPGQDCRAEHLKRIELSRTVEMIGFPGKPRMEIYTTLAGLGENGAEEIRFIQVEDLLDMPVTLGNLKHVVLGDQVDSFEFETVFTLFEFIEGVAWELGFHGTPMQCKIGR